VDLSIMRKQRSRVKIPRRAKSEGRGVRIAQKVLVGVGAEVLESNLRRSVSRGSAAQT
jgi:hypothetical protein